MSEFALSDVDYDLLIEERPGDWMPLDPFGAAGEEVKLGEDEYFVLSDHRSRGLDSRHWGTIASDQIQARTAFRFWPLSRFGRP